jgi:hypothetical protein
VRTAARRQAHCAVFDNSKIRGLVPGYTATVPFAEGVRRSVEWYEKHPERRTVDDIFNAHTERIISAYQGALGLARAAR